MIYWILLGGLGTLFVASIIVSAFAYKKQQAIYAKKSKVRQIKLKIDEYTDLANTLLNTDESYELLSIIQTQICNLYRKLVTIDEENKSFPAQLEKAENELHNYKNKERPTPPSTALTSDTEIEKANIHINTLTKFANTSYKNGKIGQTKYKDLINHLQLLKLRIEVDSHKYQAERYLEASDRVMAQSHFKQAKEALRGSAIEFPEKSQQIRELTEKIKTVLRTGEASVEQQPKETATTIDPDLKKKF